ncbi:methylmalonyl-CoA mutase family protein [Flectobacillus major]|uniref:methylmalonyl-CoA mutase family protein n=1 Tax=Flectobacillus major TaxID=103 RepID=UPI00041AE140|nr:methylmalonyl-CoA mutase family protein [Flectobacillus major]
MANSLFNDFQTHTKAIWKNQAIKDLKGKDFEETLLWQAEGDLHIESYYSQEDITDLPLGNIQKAQVTQLTRAWQNRETIALSDEKSTNLRCINALNQGANSLIIDFGSRLVTAVDFKILLNHIKLSDTPIYFKVQSQGHEVIDTLEKLIPYLMKGGVQDDLLSHWMQSGKIDDLAWGRLADSIRKVQNHPQFKVVHLSSEVFHNAGANIIQEVAFTLANTIEAIDQLTNLGLELSQIVQKLEFSLAVGTDYFAEIAKIRAFKYLWSKVLSEGYGYENSPLPISIQCKTSAYFDAALTPNTNMLRATTEAMSAIIGGCDALSIHAYNATYEQDDDFGQRIARNISTILKEESYLDKVIDPSAGSYYLENLTFAIAEKSFALLQEISQLGGSIKAFEQEWIQKQIATNQERRASNIQLGKAIMIGVNKFRADEKPFIYQPKTQVSASNFALLPNLRLSEVIEQA